MDETSYLKDAIVAPGAGADLIARKAGGLARLEPLTHRAERWLHHVAPGEASWDSGALVVELRYFPTIADAAIAAGLTFERDPLPN